MQCHHVNNHTGRCERDALPGSEYCPIHENLKPKKKNPEGFAKRMYMIQDQQRRARHAELLDNDNRRSLREELMIARLLLEERLNSAQTEADKISSQGAINSLLSTIEKLENSSLKLDQTTGNLLSKTTLLKIASSIVQIIIEELIEIPQSELIVDRISDRIFKTIADIEN